ncbi:MULTISPECIES: sugar phosphate nucleotidyltransferase [unclassified Crossiella]|uniref:sugar phosphate nucleotidyltransferase n=1 Tax=unclassified Crossiella TaxID=2620835 RepID=UPI001FFFB7AC|nr:MULTISPECIES: sugar phosphate nucleotidyltransferase [unclassified Crossiella]MCK2240523.1 sugar phosphate nucleotidyltransferase [Crossiella sp. S99.2]MCK2253026.1 sugar phosphate nucleotidyltransferase [Crossiella sp. S99.1]
MHAIILAGGKGVRLRPYTTCLPKPLVPIGDEFSILDIVMTQLAHSGFRSATLAIGYLGDLIRSYVGDGSKWGMAVDYAEEENPLGTIGPVVQLLDTLPEHFLVMNGDVLTDLDYGALLAKHSSENAPLTVATYERQVKIDFGVLTAAEGKIVEFTEKPTLDYRVSMGVYGVSREALRGYTPGLPLGFDELVLDLLKTDTPPNSYEFNGYWLDIGRPDDYDRANAEFPVLRHSLLKDTPLQHPPLKASA